MARQCTKAPLTAAQRKQLKADCADLRATAARKQCTLDNWDHAIESSAARDYFELGCWLFWFTREANQGRDTLELRTDIARRIFAAGLTNPHYMFYTAFDFGERQFDNIFEQGDSKDVIEGLRAHLVNTNVRQAFEYFGWPLVCQAQGQLI